MAPVAEKELEVGGRTVSVRQGLLHGGLFLLCLIPFFVLIVQAWDWYPSLQASDYAQYVAHARALVEGRPYTDTGYLYSELTPVFAPPAYPPGLPVVLAASFVIFGSGMAVAKVVTLLLALILPVAAGLYFARAQGLSFGLGVVLLVGLSPMVIEHSISPLTDIPFAGLVWLTLALAEPDRPMSVRRALAITAAAGLGIVFRPHGMVLVPALLVWGLLRPAAERWTALIPGAVLGGLTLIGRAIVPAAALRALPNPGGVLSRWLSVDSRYHLAVFESHLYPFSGDFANDVYHAVSVPLMLVGLVAFFWRHRTSLVLFFTVFYVLALAGFGGAQFRWAMPLFPLFVFGLLNGLRLALGWLAGKRAGSYGAVGVAAVVALLAVGQTMMKPPPTPLHHDPDYRQLLAYLRGGVAAGGELRLASSLPRVIALETDVPGSVLPARAAPENLARSWCDMGTTHVLLGGFSGATRIGRLPAGMTEFVPDAFAEEFTNDRFRLLRLDRRRLGCAGAGAS